MLLLLLLLLLRCHAAATMQAIWMGCSIEA
jgi:hypothetical protein